MKIYRARVRTVSTAILLSTASLLLFSNCTTVDPAPEGVLSADFLNPPMEVRPSGYWWWLYNNVDKASITRDLEEFRDKGLGAVLLVCSGNWSAGKLPEGPPFLSPEWRVLFLHALDEAARLGITVDMNIAPGWNMGGPWITPENACRWYLQSELLVEGPRSFNEPLPLPGVNEGYNDKPQLGVYHQMRVPMEEADYRDTAVVAFRVPAEVEGDFKTTREDLHKKSARADGNVFVLPAEIMAAPRQPWQNEEADVNIPVTSVIDLSGYLSDDGTLTWEVPEGRWVIVRTGHRKTGAKLSVPLPDQQGLENDFFDRAGVEQMFEHSGKLLAEWAGDHAGTTLRAFCSDSFEAGYPNWTANLPRHFEKYRGYSMIPYLPVLRGYLVGNAEISDRFLHDYRKTLADCMADEHYGRFAELCAEYGIKVRAEPAGPNWSSTVNMDALKNLGRTHFPQGEFWRKTFVIDGQNQNSKQTASGARIYGRKTASAEAFTSQGRAEEGWSIHWSAYPAVLKPLADRAFCEGINNIVFHTLTSQRPQDGLPGYAYGAGTHFNPNRIWWQQSAGPFLDYLNRCQVMLQSGQFVADVLFYNGDWSPNQVGPERIHPDLGPGYDFDYCNEEVLLTRLSVEDGKIVLPDGMSYRILVLPDETRMPAAVAQKIKELVEAGATVIGPRPKSDPGLLDYPRNDEAVRAIATELWGPVSESESQTTLRRIGHGRLVEGTSPRDVLLGDGILPDFEYEATEGTHLDFIHRSDDEADWYFVVNRKKTSAPATLTFRQEGRQPELWHPVTGEQRTLPSWRSTEGARPRTQLDYKFGPHESVFIVFRKPGTPAPGKNYRSYAKVQSVEGPWTLSFEPEWFYPLQEGEEPKLVFDELQDLTEHANPAVKYYSGMTTYRSEFNFTGDPTDATDYHLALGQVSHSARVILNGTDLGVVWCDPWQLNTQGALKSGRNEVVIEVANTWLNRLVGDGFLPEDQRRTRTNIRHFYIQERRGNPITHKIMPAGLKGPVQVIRKL
ncbi:MAG: glycosyl hydrolase [Opitutales bacterium]